MYATLPSINGWQVIRIEAGVAHLVAVTVDQAHAERIRDLLDRHGLVDVPLDQIGTA
jgi:hypothetical protein